MIERDSAREFYDLGRTLLKSGRDEAAIDAFQQSARLTPHFKTYELLGECLIRQGRSAEAISALVAAVGLGNRPFRARYLLARALAATGDRAGAIESLREAIRLQSSYKAARLLLDELVSPDQ